MVMVEGVVVVEGAEEEVRNTRTVILLFHCIWIFPIWNNYGIIHILAMYIFSRG